MDDPPEAPSLSLASSAFRASRAAFLGRLRLDPMSVSAMKKLPVWWRALVISGDLRFVFFSSRLRDEVMVGVLGLEVAFPRWNRSWRLHDFFLEKVPIWLSMSPWVDLLR